MTLSNNLARRVLARVADYLHVTEASFRERNGTGSALLLRGQAMWVMRQLGLSWQEVAILFGERADVHTIVNTVEKRRADEKATVYKKELDDLLAFARTVAEEVGSRPDPPLTVAIAPVVAEPKQNEPPLVALLRTFRDEFDRISRDAHRLSMLADRALVRLEHREEEPITVGVEKQDEAVEP